VEKALRSFGSGRWRLTRVLGLADGIQLLLKRECVERTERQVDEDGNAIIEHSKRVGEGKADFSLVAGGGGGRAPQESKRCCGIECRPCEVSWARRGISNISR
jgi:hypothetical protein